MRSNKIVTSGNFIPGLTAQKTQQYIIEKDRYEQRKNQQTDGDYRRYITSLIQKNIEQGKTMDEAVEIALKDDVAKKFEYLTKNGLDIKQCFKNWAEAYISKHNKKYRNLETER